MSSKSRKHSSKPARKPQGGASHGADGHGKSVAGELEYAEPSEKDFLIDDELLKTPKGRSPLVYAFLVLLLIFLTVIFILPSSSLQGWSSGDDPVSLRWTDPSTGLHELKNSDLQNARLRYETVLEQGGAYAVGVLPQSGFVDPRRPSEVDIVRLLIADEMARNAGIEISDRELASAVTERLVPLFGGLANYQARLRTLAHIGGVRGYETTFRSLLRIERLLELTGLAASVPTAAGIEQSWNESHEEFRFEWVKATIADFTEAARAEQPDEAALQTWLDELNEFERSQFLTERRYGAELAGVVVGEEERDLAALHARFPRPEDYDAEGRAKQFYQNYFSSMYVRPAVPKEDAEDAEDGAEAGAEDGADVESPAAQDIPSYWPFDEVAARAERDARTHAALTDWLKDIQARAAVGEEVDLAAEAAEFGLDYQRSEGLLTSKEWRELGGLANSQSANRIAGLAEPGQFSPSPAIGGGGISIVRLLERTEPFVPPAAEIREELLALYEEQRAEELAEAALVALRDKLLADAPKDESEGEEATDGTDTDESAADGTEADGTAGDESKPATTSDDFHRDAAALGLEVGVRDWLDRRATASDDPDWLDDVHALIRANAQLYALGAGELSQVLRPFGKLDALFLVRAEGSREIPIERMNARQYRYETRASAEVLSFREFLFEGPFSESVLRGDYGLWLRSEEEAAKAKALSDAAEAEAQN